MGRIKGKVIGEINTSEDNLYKTELSLLDFLLNEKLISESEYRFCFESLKAENLSRNTQIANNNLII